MDKSQKELIKTYYRKRGIAAKENDIYELKDYEIDFSIKNKLMPQNELDKLLMITIPSYMSSDDKIEKIKLLIQSGADVNHIGKFRETPLIWASREGNLEMVKLLIEKGADVNGLGVNGLTPLMIASDWNRLDVVKLLIEKGADVNAKNINGNTTLMGAYRDGNSEVADLLKQAGAKK